MAQYDLRDTPCRRPARTPTGDDLPRTLETTAPVSGVSTEPRKGAENVSRRGGDGQFHHTIQ